jgi:hypothetical protein
VKDILDLLSQYLDNINFPLILGAAALRGEWQTVFASIFNRSTATAPESGRAQLEESVRSDHEEVQES